MNLVNNEDVSLHTVEPSVTSTNRFCCMYVKPLPSEQVYACWRIGRRRRELDAKVVVVVVVEIFVHGAVKATVTNAPQSQLNKWVFGSFLNWPTVVSDWCSEVGRLHGKGVERVSPGKWGDRVYCLPSQPTAQSGGALWAHDEFYSFYISRKVEQQYGDDRNRLWILLCALYCRAFTLSSDLRESRDRVMGQLPHLLLPRGDPNDSAM